MGVNRGRLATVLVVASLMLPLAGCKGWITTNKPRVSPTTVGVIAEARRAGLGSTNIVFTDGRTLMIPGKAQNHDGGYSINVDALLLVGESPQGPWYEVIAPSFSGEAGCFDRGGFARRDGDLLVFDDGLVLPLAPDFDPGLYKDGRFDDARRQFCINERGEAISY